MLSFAHTRYRRLSVTLRELTLGESISLCKLPADRHELTITELLKCIAGKAQQPLPQFVTDPLLWTVQERNLLLSFYLAQVTEDGSPDFAVGKLKLSDYLDTTKDSTKDETDLGMVASKRRVMRPLLGAHAQALELICNTRGDWILGCIACQVFEVTSTAGKDYPDWATTPEAELREWIAARIEHIKALPESMFEELYAAWLIGSNELEHFFATDLDDKGIVLLSQEKEGAGPRVPARFSPLSCVSETAQLLAK